MHVENVALYLTREDNFEYLWFIRKMYMTNDELFLQLRSLYNTMELMKKPPKFHIFKSKTWSLKYIFRKIIFQNIQVNINKNWKTKYIFYWRLL